jgi:hypothetical protein
VQDFVIPCRFGAFPGESPSSSVSTSTIHSCCVFGHCLWLMPKQHSWCCFTPTDCLLRPSHSDRLPHWTTNIPPAMATESPPSVLTSRISSQNSSSSCASPTGFRFSASTLVCFIPGRCRILKLKSYSRSIQRPLLPFASDIVASHSNGL